MATKRSLPTVSIILPNWNGEELLKQHLPAVVRAARGAEIIIVDDASTDGSVAYIRKSFPDIRVIETSAHEGFAGSVNAGVAHAAGEIVVLLNTDVEPEPDFLKHLLPHFNDPQVFAVGCMDRSHEQGKTVLRGRGVARWEKGFYVHARGDVGQTDTAWVSGGSGAFRKSVWQKLGGMDELMNPFYWEDIDLSYRARKAGYRVIFSKQCCVDHYHEQGAILSRYERTFVTTVAFRNELIFHWKNITSTPLFITHLMMLMKNLLVAAVSINVPVLRGFLMALITLPAVIRTRKKQNQIYVHTDSEMDVY